MLPVTFLIADLEYSSHAKQLSLLAPALRAAGHPVSVFSLTGVGPLTHQIEAAGISIEGRHAHRPWDLGDWFALRRRLRATRDGIVHVFGPSALRRLHFATIDMALPPIVLSLTGREFLGLLDIWLARRMKRVLVPHAIAAARMVHQGVPSRLVAIVPPAVGEAPPPPDRQAYCDNLGMPADSRFVVAAGRMNRRQDLFGAVWSFEFVRYPDEQARLLVIGDGPARGDLESSAHGLAPDGSRVHFLGQRADLAAILALADLVAIPQPTGGANFALEAMAAGRAVTVADTPDLRAVVRDCETGIVVPVNNAPEAGRIQYALLCDPEERRRLGDAARVAVLKSHAVDSIVQAVESIYEE
jgi:glycosyltransferase involved in cell wall biosynthesis